MLHWVFIAFALAFSSSREQGLLFVMVLRLLIEEASLVAEYGLWGTQAPVVPMHNQRLNPCPLHWQAES